jgi:Dyp-type peroxidase family
MPKFHALCLGISNYPGATTIPSAEPEAAKLHRHLQARGIGSTLITGPRATLARLRAELARLRDVCSAGDHLIVYFSGHGGQHGQAAVEADLTSPEYLLLYDEVLMDNVLEEEIRNLPGVNVLLLLDACHAAGMSPDLAVLSERMSRAKAGDRWVQTMAAAREGDLAAGTATNGDMSRGLLQVLAAAKLPDTYADFFAAVRAAMPETANPVHRSTPASAEKLPLVLGQTPPPLLRQEHQAHVLFGFPAHRHQALCFFRITDPHRFKAALRAGTFWPTPAHEYSRQGRETASAIAFSFAGLFELGAPELIKVGERSRAVGQALIDELERSKMPGKYELHPLANRPAFEVGMPHRSVTVLHDPWQGLGSRAWWKIPDGKPVHGLILVAADTEEKVNGQVASLPLAAAGIEQVNDVQHGQARQRDHFGFRDGIAVPGIAAVEGDAVSILPQTATSVHAMDRLLLRGDEVPSWALDGSFLVYRRLNQDTEKLNELVQSLEEQLQVSRTEALAMLVGRRPDGSSLEQPAPAKDMTQRAHVPKSEFDQFDYGTRQCPAFAHARKTNPRSATIPTPPLFRRGVFFGHENESDRGLHFMCYQASIEGHFELISCWMNKQDLPEQAGGLDLLLGRNVGSNWPSPRTVPTAKDLSECIYPTGGEYLFAPTINGLRELVGSDE